MKDPLALRWVAGASFVMAAALGIGRFAYTPLLPEMVSYFDWSYAQAGDIASANFLGYLVGALLAPLLTQSPAVRAWFAFSLMGSVLTTFLGSEISSYSQWFAVRIGSGMASAFCLVIVTTRLMALLAERDAQSLGNVHFAGVGLGIVLSTTLALIGGLVETQWARQGLCAAVLMMLAWLLMREQGWSVVPQVAAQDASERGESGIWRLITGYGLFGFGYVISATFIVAMGQLLSVQNLDARWVWIVVGAATVPSVYLWQWYANARGVAVALRAAYLVLALGALLAGIATNIPVLLFSAVLLGGTFGGVTALGLSAGRAVDPTRTAWVVSTMTVAFSLGQLLGPAVAGRMADALGGFLWPSVLAALLMVLSALLVPRIVPPVVTKEERAR